ncbi:hypothetical protein M9M90_14415 [Phenylobacterium sp. LH3H17]|uniref:hypothetical protein n=1 Tax=Phenylobacterium sp. LH3H17 TaxID=2903901 RepID=UPI0020C9D644|nr:hypothetical protein [Phenylobacterium sp. LH3H17]UTP38403.1 hypothetical protein M9M90_14415 [Phenylobacterium sp. LH3H17]
MAISGSAETLGPASRQRDVSNIDPAIGDALTGLCAWRTRRSMRTAPLIAIVATLPAQTAAEAK